MGFEYLDVENVPPPDSGEVSIKQTKLLGVCLAFGRVREDRAMGTGKPWFLAAFGSLGPFSRACQRTGTLHSCPHYTAVPISRCHIDHLQTVSVSSEGASCLPAVRRSECFKGLDKPYC